MSFYPNQSLETVWTFLIIFGVFESIFNILPTNNVLGKTSDERLDLRELLLLFPFNIHSYVFFLYDGPASSPQDITLPRK